MLFDGGRLARTRRLGDNAGMAGDDGRAQVQLDEDTLARRRRDLGEDHPDTLAAASNLAVSLRAAGEYQAARELGRLMSHEGMSRLHGNVCRSARRSG